jgi:DNA-nicking Smr family endonuclease
MRQRLMRGQIEIDGTIDLHGMRQAEARAALQRFVLARAARGDRTILVITGKGLKKIDDTTIVERGVLRSMLPIWLSEPTLAPLIAGWDVSAQGHGGEGAYYVRLRRVTG